MVLHIHYQTRESDMNCKDRQLKVLSDGREAVRDHYGEIFVNECGVLRKLRGAEKTAADCDMDGWSQNPAAHAAFKRRFG